MTLSRKQLFTLVATTLGGVRIGRVVDIELDTVAQNVVAYHVRPFWRVPTTSPLLLIKRSQVVRITETELIVEDALLPIREPVARKNADVLRAPVV